MCGQKHNALSTWLTQGIVVSEMFTLPSRGKRC